MSSPSIPVVLEAQYQELVEEIVKVMGYTEFDEHRFDDEGFCFHCGKSIGNADEKCSQRLGLEDVLRAVQFDDDLLPAYCEPDWYYVVPKGAVAEFRMSKNRILGEWLLGKPLSEQTPETIEFLHSILCS